MKVDNRGMVNALRRAVNEDDRDMENFLAGEIARNLDAGDALLAALRDVLDTTADWERGAYHADALDARKRAVDAIREATGGEQ